MPKVIKKRAVKKKAFREDEVKSAAREALDKIRARQKQVIIAVTAVIAILIVYAVYALYSSSTRNRAYALEREAYNYYYGMQKDQAMSEQVRWEKALELYKESVHLVETPSALYYMGNSYYNLKDYASAIKEYQRFIDRFSGQTEVLPLVYQKLASAYFAINENDKALDTLDRLAGVNRGVFRDTSLILQARYYERAGEKEKAMEKYRQIISDFPVSPWSAEAGSKVSAEDKQTPEGVPETAGDADEQTMESPGVEGEDDTSQSEQPERP